MKTSIFEKLFRENFPALVNYASRILKDQSAAEEVVQNVFANIWAKKDFLKIHTSPVSYLYKSVYNACLNSNAHKNIIQKYIDASEIETYFNYVIQHPQAEKELHAKEIEKAIIDACEILSPKTREVFIRSRIKGMKNSLIAQDLGITVKTVENHINIATKKLKKELEWLIVLLYFYNI